jgi:hypothetical protein
MTRYEDVQSRLAARERKNAAFRQDAVETYGERLGNALSDYLQDVRSDGSSSEKSIQALAETVTIALESDTHEGKVNGIKALLTAVEAKIAPIANEAHQARISNALF